MLNEIHLLETKDAIKSEFLDEYLRGIQFFHMELTYLNTNIFIMDYVLTFPYDLFVAADQSLFFRMVFQNFFYSSIMMITRIVTDTGSDLYTLPHFKNNLIDWIKEEYKDLLIDRLKQAKFDKDVRDMFERSRKLRTERLAHLQANIVLGKIPATKVVFGELKSMLKSLNSLLDAISFNVDMVKLPFQYASAESQRATPTRKPDIEIILDMIARKSHMLNLPEKNPSEWERTKKYLEEDKIEQLNKYRSKFGLHNI
jgi:hypothetical protein